jgi:hypothetical protein
MILGSIMNILPAGYLLLDPRIALTARQLLIDPQINRGSFYQQGSHYEMPIKEKLHLYFAGNQQLSQYILPLSSLTFLNYHIIDLGIRTILAGPPLAALILFSSSFVAKLI